MELLVLSSSGAEVLKESGNGINPLAALDPCVEDHALLPNLAWDSGSSGNLIKYTGRGCRLQP